jgi:predicted dehydrogenase
MLNSAIIGCGKIADSHGEQLQQIPGVQLAAACDREPLMAEQFCERFKVPRQFSDLSTLLHEVKPDVVHITTPPQSHFDVARQCLEAGCHVYVEKPFTLTTAEAEALIELADKRRLKVTAGHDDQFRPAARRMRALVREGYLGGNPVHMESYYCYEFGGSYAKALLADKQHWVRRLPGGLLHNIISHGIARIAEFLPGVPRVVAHGFTSPSLCDLGETEIVDELRVYLVSQAMTAYFTFSSQMRPALHQFRIFGPKNGIQIDQDNETLVRLPGKRRRSYLEQFITPLSLACEYASSSGWNIRAFVNGDFHPKSGMRFLMAKFYGSIQEGGPPPIAYSEILQTSRIMDDIFAQIRISEPPCSLKSMGPKLVQPSIDTVGLTPLLQ